MNFNEEANIGEARRILIEITSFLDMNKIPYKLEGGTLLGLFRDGDLLPWDHDLDISIGIEDSKRFSTLRRKLLLKGYRVTKQISKIEKGPIRKGDVRIFKIKPLWKSLLKFIIPKIEKSYIITDVFVKVSDDKYTYWQAMKKVFRVEKKHYMMTEEINFESHQLKIPAYPDEYLTKKYGNWSIPVKEWDCSKDEKATF